MFQRWMLQRRCRNGGRRFQRGSGPSPARPRLLHGYRRLIGLTRVRLLFSIIHLMLCLRLISVQSPLRVLLAALRWKLMISATVWNVQGLNHIDHQVSLRNLISENSLYIVGLLETRVATSNFVRVQRGLLPRWNWFVDYAGPGSRIWLAWDNDFVGVDVLDVDVQHVHCRVEIRGECHFALVDPKVQQPTLVAEFRPISCCNVLYKGITKIIVQRMRGLLGSIVPASQNAFVPGRPIGDNILLAQELFTGYNRQHLHP
ncbi:UNVERIFIED_CONTAM: hypothetical protein Sradi_2998200 [Sesamum radiatum]|uniref:Reverse transcriptase domain-containing protein n=1 Tax=Sesamum radiatum TaxID=300843 RepID=A0AAW2S0U4_SESRA